MPWSMQERRRASSARGLVAYDADDAARIVGRKSGEIDGMLGFRGRDEMVHRDDLVLVRAAERCTGACR